MSGTANFRQQLQLINDELKSSLERLQTLLKKTRTDIEAPEVRYNPDEREHLEKVIQGLQEKISEIRSIGLAGK